MAQASRRKAVALRYRAAEMLRAVPVQPLVDEAPGGLPGNPAHVARHTHDVECLQCLEEVPGPEKVTEKHVVVDKDQYRRIDGGSLQRVIVDRGQPLSVVFVEREFDVRGAK